MNKVKSKYKNLDKYIEKLLQHDITRIWGRKSR